MQKLKPEVSWHVWKYLHALLFLYFSSVLDKNNWDMQRLSTTSISSVHQKFLNSTNIQGVISFEKICAKAETRSLMAYLEKFAPALVPLFLIRFGPKQSGLGKTFDNLNFKRTPKLSKLDEYSGSYKL